MNLHGIVRSAVAVVNPTVFATLRVSAGYTIGADLKQIPQYHTIHNVPCQMQALTYTDLMKIDGMNIQGTRRAIYISGDVQGVNRAEIKGGDLFTFADGTEWLVVQALETWPQWSKVCVTQQLGNTHREPN